MKKKINKRALKFGSEAIIITVLTIAAVVILNVAFTALCYRFSWYSDMSANLEYKISEDCENYIKSSVIPKLEGKEKITILFCDEEEVVAGDDTQKYAYNSALELKEMFEGKIEVEFLNVWEHPKRARELGVKSSYDVVVMCGDEHYTINQSSLFMTDSTTQTVVAYHGEKRLAAAMSRVVSEDDAMCYITVNHGEAMDSYELLYTLADAGYSCNFLDILNFDIPEDCELLLMVDPKQDLTHGSSEANEVQKIKDFLDKGKNLMVFISPDSFASGGFENLEGLLEEWGADFYHAKGESGSEEYYQIKDSSHATSVDGYTIFGQNNSDIFGKGTSPAIFENTTCINVSDKYTKADGNSYKANIEGRDRVFTPIITSYNTAEAYAGGRVVKKASDTPFTLMSKTEQNYNGKTSRVFVCASVAFASEGYMQSTVYGNNEVISAIAKDTGRENAPYMLVAKPFPTTEMQSVTTRAATVITVCLATTFALAAAISGAVILIKRKNAM